MGPLIESKLFLLIGQGDMENLFLTLEDSKIRGLTRGVGGGGGDYEMKEGKKNRSKILITEPALIYNLPRAPRKVTQKHVNTDMQIFVCQKTLERDTYHPAASRAVIATQPI